MEIALNPGDFYYKVLERVESVTGRLPLIGTVLTEKTGPSPLVETVESENAEIDSEREETTGGGEDRVLQELYDGSEEQVESYYARHVMAAMDSSNPHRREVESMMTDADLEEKALFTYLARHVSSEAAMNPSGDEEAERVLQSLREYLPTDSCGGLGHLLRPTDSEGTKWFTQPMVYRASVLGELGYDISDVIANITQDERILGELDDNITRLFEEYRESAETYSHKQAA